MSDPNKLSHPLSVNIVTGEARLATESEIAEYESRSKITETTVFTLEVLRRAVEMMKENNIPTRTVLSQREADDMTAHDPAGHVWETNEQYYVVDSITGKFVTSAEQKELL